MLRNLLILIIILCSITLSSAASYSPGDIEWGTPVTGTISKGGTLTNGEFMVKAAQFTSPVPGIKDINGNIVPETDIEPMVFLEVYKSGVLIKEIVMNLQSEAYIDPDYEVKVWASGFTAKNAREWVFEYYNPSATISIQKRAIPKLEVSVTTDKNAYTSYEDNIITAKITVTNSGEARIKNVDFSLDPGELKLRGGDVSQLHQYFNKLEKGSSQSFETILVVPELIDQKSYTMSANAKGFDIKDIEYKASTSVSITVSPKQNYFTVGKAVRDRMYLQNTAMVRITVTNAGMYDAYSIYITDSMSENFELKSNTSLQWFIPVLKPTEWKDFDYSIKPLETNLNGFTLPAASAQFTVNNKPYSASSQTPTIVVNGPKIVLNKTVDKPAANLNEEVTVTVSINNIGNIPTKAEVKDFLPEGASLVSGSTELKSTFLELNTPQTFSYAVRMDREGEIELPSAVANYTNVEYRGTTRSVLSSEKPVITVIDPSKITLTPTIQGGTPEPAPQETTPLPTETPAPTPSPTPTYITPGFEVLLAIIVIFAAVRRRR